MKARPGQCRYCGCTEQQPCMIRHVTGLITGCWWVDAEQTVCAMPMCQMGAIEDGIIPAPGSRLVVPAGIEVS